jgi:hypothetical protein
MSASTARRPLPALVFLLVLSVLTAIVWWRVLHRNDSSSNASPVTVQPARCTPGAKGISVPPPVGVTVVVLNGAGRDQLATQVSTQLKARGFKTGTPSDAPSPLNGVAEIQFGKAGKAGATLLNFYLPGATMVTETRSDATVTLVLGAAYKSLASQPTVNAAVAKARKPC